MPLEALIRRTYLRVRATDPRDRFYALLSMCTNQNWLALRPDYKFTRDALYTKATLHLIRKAASLDSRKLLILQLHIHPLTHDLQCLHEQDTRRAFTPKLAP